MNSFLGTRILVVDDIPDNLILVQTVLEAEGYDVELADSGVKALAKIAASPPNLVLLDMSMPDMSGYELTQRIRADAKASRIPIVLLTGHQEEYLTQTMQLGVSGYIRKPIDFDKLLQRIQDICGAKALSSPGCDRA